MTSRPIARCAARRVLVVGPIPPPLHGVTVMTAALLHGVCDTGWEVVHVDTSDHRSIDNVGRLVTTRHASSAPRTSPVA